MSNLDKDSKNVLIGALIGGALGVSVMALLSSSKHHEKGKGGSLNTIGKAIAQVGEILECHNISEADSLLKDVEKKIRKEENKAVDVLEWVATGIQLWKKIKG